MTNGQHCPGCRGFTRGWQHECTGLALEAVLMTSARTVFQDDGVFGLVKNFAATLHARAENPGLLWRELVTSNPGGPYWQDWYCEPPPRQAGYRVLPGREKWATEGSDMTVRRIYAIEVLDAAAEAAAGADRRAGPGGVRPADGAGAGTPAAPGTQRYVVLRQVPAAEERPGGAGGGS